MPRVHGTNRILKHCIVIWPHNATAKKKEEEEVKMGCGASSATEPINVQKLNAILASSRFAQPAFPPPVLTLPAYPPPVLARLPTSSSPFENRHTVGRRPSYDEDEVLYI